MSGRTISGLTPVAANQEWKVLKNVPGNALSSKLVVAAPPERVSRTLVGGNLGTRAVALDRNSSIAYDAREHRFVNTNSAPTRPQGAAAAAGTTAKTGVAVEPASPRTMRVASGVPNGPSASAPVARTFAPSRAVAPPPSPRSTASGRGESGGGGGSVFQGSRASSSAAPSSASHASSGGSSGASSSGGRPH